MTISIFMRTLPYVLMRAVIYLAFTAALLVFLGVMAGIAYLATLIFPGGSGPLLIVGLVALGGLIGLVKLAQRYVLYLVKIGHVAVITELVLTGSLPDGINQFSYGKEKVTNHFGSASALFAVDQLVSQTVRQTLSWLTSMTGFLQQVPGVGAVLSIVRAIVQLVADYIDEATMSYILTREGENVWQAASDGIVLYAQSWKKLLKTAAILVVFVGLGWLVGFAIIVFPALAIAQWIVPDPGVQFMVSSLAVIGALFFAQTFRWLLVDPIATVAMVVSYQKAIEGQQVSYDLRGQLMGVSRKFRDLTDRSGAEPMSMPQPQEA